MTMYDFVAITTRLGLLYNSIFYDTAWPWPWPGLGLFCLGVGVTAA